ncbi:hypothetical protein SAY87_023807 [Trapa incisa]|uniref:Pectinesterase inhibitor domain-containing protein n=1 Tax=Trapa incisa TaxID=236973 RepID=A0AAN7QSH4_9MYRT|nr:hypothetical protein SAY87_023807 [Trapa incisa]
MASPIKSYVPYSIFLIALLLRPSSLTTAADFSSSVCSGTLDPSRCFQVIKTIPGGGQAPSLESLCGTAISFSLSKGNQFHSYVQSLAASASNPKLKQVYSSCAENYDDFIGNLQSAQVMLKRKDYNGVSTMASSSMTEVDTCSDSFKEGSVADPSQLIDKNKYYYTLSLIILRISNKLGGAA